MIDGHECKKIQIDFKNQQPPSSLSELYMGTYELSGHENGKPTWSSLTAAIYMSKTNQWWITEKNHRGYDGKQAGDIISSKGYLIANCEK